MPDGEAQPIQAAVTMPDGDAQNIHEDEAMEEHAVGSEEQQWLQAVQHLRGLGAPESVVAEAVGYRQKVGLHSALQAYSGVSALRRTGRG